MIITPNDKVYVFEYMVEKRFESIEPKKSCSDMKKEDLRCFDECKEAAYELGYHRGPRLHTGQAQNISKSCFISDGVVTWRQYGAEEMNEWSQAICRKTGKYIIQYAFSSYQPKFYV